MVLIKSVLSSTFIFVCSKHNQEIIMGTVQLCWFLLAAKTKPHTHKKVKKNNRASSSGFSASENSVMERFQMSS